MSEKSLDALPEVFLSRTKISSMVSRAANAGLLRPLAPRLYTKNLIDPPEAIVRRHLWPLVASYLPGALVADRTALENVPAKDGSVFLVAQRRREADRTALGRDPALTSALTQADPADRVVIGLL